MKGKLKFLIETYKLKRIPRTGLVVWRAKNPATIADHTFRTAFSSCLLGRKKNLNIERVLKMVLAHDLCEVYAGDLTPLFYYTRRAKRMMRWFRLPKAEREKRSKQKLNVEKKAIRKLIKPLDPDLQKEIFSFWFDFSTRISLEAKFVKQVDRIETLLESIEYIGINEKITGKGWWEGTEETVEDPLLVDFLHVLQKKFYGSVPKLPKNEKELKNILNFLLSIGKLRNMPRLYWQMRGMKKPETVAGHIFSVALLAWIFGREKPGLDMEKLLKMALCHELSAVYTGDSTPYDENLPKNQKAKKETLEKLPRLLKKEKTKRFLIDYKAEKNALLKLTSKLEPDVQREIIQLWHEYRQRSSPEGHFLTQLNVLAILIEALLYRQENKKFSVSALWEWAFEICDDPITISLMDEIKKNFYKR